MPAGIAPLESLEERLGYAFQDRAVLARALTHKSAGAENFERLEFLGDAALGFVVARVLFDAIPNATEHELTLMRANLVRRDSLATVARSLGLGDFIQLGTGERKSGVAKRNSILADALEAVVGAVVCDGGIDCAAAVARRIFADRLVHIDDGDLKDPKTRLQEYLQGQHLEPPTYEVVHSSGPHHERRFTSVCLVESLRVRAEGRGRSRRDAEKNAAAAVLERLAP